MGQTDRHGTLSRTRDWYDPTPGKASRKSRSRTLPQGTTEQWIFSNWLQVDLVEAIKRGRSVRSPSNFSQLHINDRCTPGQRKHTSEERCILAGRLDEKRQHVAPSGVQSEEMIPGARSGAFHTIDVTFFAVIFPSPWNFAAAGKTLGRLKFLLEGRAISTAIEEFPVLDLAGACRRQDDKIRAKQDRYPTQGQT